MSARAAQRPTLATVITGGKVVGFLLDRGLAGTEAWTAEETSIGTFADAKLAHEAVLRSRAT